MQVTKAVARLLVLAVAVGAAVTLALLVIRVGSKPSRAPQAESTAPARQESPPSPRIHADTERVAVGTPAGSSTPGTSVRIRVTDDYGKVLPGARLFLVDIQNFTQPGPELDQGGEATITVNEGLATLCAVSKGFQCESVEAQRLTHPLTTLSLRPAGTILGRVQKSDSSVGETTFVVVGVPRGPRGGIVSAATIRAIAARDPRSRTTTTDKEGRFSLEGLDPSQEYDLVAAGAGYASGDWAERVIPNGSPVTLDLLPVFVLTLSLELEGGHVGGCARILPDQEGVLGLGDAGAFQLPLELATLAGLSSSLVEGADDWHPVYALSSRAAGVTSLNVKYTARFPGFDPIEFEAKARRLDATVSVTRLVLSPTLATRRGRAHVSFQDPCGKQKLGGIRGILLLHSEEGTTFRVPIEAGESDAEICDIPMGTYKCRFVGTQGFLRVPVEADQWLACVVGNQSAEIKIVLDVAGELQIKIVDRDGRASAKPLSIGLSRLTDGSFVPGNETVLLTGAPDGTYAINNLPVGVYQYRAYGSVEEVKDNHVVGNVRNGICTISACDRSTLELREK